jgi:hypothetical protein
MTAQGRRISIAGFDSPAFATYPTTIEVSSMHRRIASIPAIVIPVGIIAGVG